MANRQTLLKMAQDIGRMRALDELGLLKTAGILDSLLGRSSSVLIPAGLGYVMGGPEHRLEGAVGGALGGHLGMRALRHLGTRELREVIKAQPSLKRYAGVTDSELVRGLRGDPIFTKAPGLAQMREDFLPLLRQYEGIGNLTGGALAGYGVGTALNSQDRPQEHRVMY